MWQTPLFLFPHLKPQAVLAPFFPQQYLFSVHLTICGIEENSRVGLIVIPNRTIKAAVETTFITIFGLCPDTQGLTRLDSPTQGTVL